MNCTNTYTNMGDIMTSAKVSAEAFHRRLKKLYPCVEDVSKLPQAWSSESKAPALGLTYNKLGCYFRTNSRREDDEKFAAAVRTDHSIPPSCLLYYFEIRFLSKGREGFMGLGLASAQALLNKLPGWVRESYGYHADDGNIFSGDGRGSAFGPTFTTGDVIGCGYNLVEGTCFFTKNGLNLGNAFDDIPSNVMFYPTVGLKTPGEDVEANFGQLDFVYDIEQDLRSLRKNMTFTISNYPISDYGNWQNALHNIVQSWLLLNSYPNSADAFTRATKGETKENMQRIQVRNRIQQLVLNGKISEAIKSTNNICPNLLQNNPNLLFALKCRQFIELISGAENDFQPIFDYANNATTNSIDNNNATNNSNGLVKIDVKGDQPETQQQPPHTPSSDARITTAETNTHGDLSSHLNIINGCNGMIGDNNCEKLDDRHSTSSSSYQELMDIDQPTASNATNSNSNNFTDTNNHHQSSLSYNTSSNGQNQDQQQQQQTSENKLSMDINESIDSQTSVIKDTDMDLNEQKYVKLIEFGQELCEYLQRLDKLYGKNDVNEKMLRDAIGLIALVNPKDSYFDKLLDPKEREPLSQLLNSSIVKAEMGESYRPSLEEVMNHLRKLVKLNDSHGTWLIDQLY